LLLALLDAGSCGPHQLDKTGKHVLGLGAHALVLAMDAERHREVGQLQRTSIDGNGLVGRADLVDPSSRQKERIA